MNYVTKRSKLGIPSSISFPESGMSEARDCVVKLVDDYGVEHSVRVRAESVYEAALRGLQKPDGLLSKFGKSQLNIGFTSGKCLDG
jgi:hypothetical protein